MADTPEPPSDIRQRETVDLPPGPPPGDSSTPERRPGRDTLPSPGGGTVVTGPFGDYELLGEIERGGMGVVYRARERHSGLLVALKMMLQAADAADSDRHRFVLEARATGELNHPGVVALHSWGEHRGHPFYTMDFVPGVALSRLLERGPLPCDRAVRYLLGIARAVGAAHALGIVHRDLKPGNVIIDLSDQPRVLDFGLAKRLRGGDAPNEDAVLDVLPADAPAPLPAALAQHTEKGAILGTPSYMAPEQVRAEHDQVGPAADVHALGALFYEMVTGRPPYRADSTYETLLQVLQQEPEPLGAHARGVPATLEAFCRRCLEKEPHRRYPNANALADDLERRWQRAVRAARFARLSLAAGLALVLLAGAGLLFGGGWLPLHLAALDNLAAAGDPVGRAAPALADLLRLVVLVLGPYLANLGLVVWLGAWAWNDDRPWRAFAGAALAAGAVLVPSFIAPGLEVLREGPLYLGWLLLADALVLFGVLVVRQAKRPDRPERDSRSASAEPYLEKLFASRVEAGARPAAGSGPRDSVGLADFELGKVLHRWDDHEVRWARQKSLNRPTLVWLDRAPPTGRGVPGVVVRHPSVLGLHAVGTTPEGSFLVTEPVAASPLEEVLGQRGLVPAEAAALTARLARTVQTFHDQGACHGRLGAGWVLLRGDLEPVLCPCGFPSQSAEDRARDVRDLGALLRSWLPPRPGAWQRRLLAPLYRAAEAACSGACARAGDLADDLGRAVAEVQRRGREYWMHALVLVLLVVPLLVPPGRWLLGLARRTEKGEAQQPAAGSGDFAGYLLLALAPCAGLLGYIQVRALVRRWRERGTRRGLAEGWQRLRFGLLLPLVEVLLLAVAAGALALLNAPASGETGPTAVLPLVAAEFAGTWLLGASLAGLVTFLESLFSSLHALQPAREPSVAEGSGAV
jgi:tRNA A-37 threonylcarbamoyl transferase component Bud32